MKIHIKNGHVIDPKNKIDHQLDVFITAGKITAMKFTIFFQHQIL